MRIQSRDADLAQESGGLSEVMTGRHSRNSLGEVGGNGCPRSVEVVWGVLRAGKSDLKRSDVRGHRRTLAFISAMVGTTEAGTQHPDRPDERL